LMNLRLPRSDNRGRGLVSNHPTNSIKAPIFRLERGFMW
jgi:hypothetical protein